MHREHLTALPKPSTYCILLQTQDLISHALPCHHVLSCPNLPFSSDQH